MPVHHAAHPVLPDAVVDEVAARIGRPTGPSAPAMAMPVLPVRSALPGMSPGIVLAGGVEAGLDGLAGGHGPVLGGERWGAWPPSRAARGPAEPASQAGPVAVPGVETRSSHSSRQAWPRGMHGR